MGIWVGFEIIARLLKIVLQQQKWTKSHLAQLSYVFCQPTLSQSSPLHILSIFTILEKFHTLYLHTIL